MNFTTLHPPLIADPDPFFLQKLVEDPGATLAPPVTVVTSKALEDQLEHGRYVFSGIFINLEMVSEEAVEFLAKIRHTRPSTPIYLISNESSSLLPLNQYQLNLMTVQAVLPKPFTYTQVLKRVAAAQAPETRQIQYTRDSWESARLEIALTESEFIPALVAQFLAGAPSYFSLYVRFSENRFIKILRDGDSLGHDRLEFYRQKAIERFYIRSDAYERFLANCRQALEAAEVRVPETPL